jgi:hypothetical protein
MPATMSNPRDVYLALLGDLLFVERTLSFETLPQMLADAGDPALARAMAEHLEQTKAHVGRVEQAFRSAGAEASSNHSLPVAGWPTCCARTQRFTRRHTRSRPTACSSCSPSLSRPRR